MEEQWIGFISALLGAAVEATEAVTIVLAVGLSVGWTPTLRAAAAGLLLLAVVIAVGGEVLLSRVPAAALELAIGTLLLLFGLRWLHKAVLRAAGAMAKRDERVQFTRVGERLEQRRDRRGGASIAFWGVVLEGLEVVVIVVGVSAGAGGLAAPAAGAAVAIVLVCAAGVLLRRPLAAVPENTLKLVVGVALSSLGTFWVAEGVGVHWPGDLASLPVVIVIFTAAAALATTLSRPRRLGDAA